MPYTCPITLDTIEQPLGVWINGDDQPFYRIYEAEAIFAALKQRDLIDPVSQQPIKHLDLAPLIRSRTLSSDDPQAPLSYGNGQQYAARVAEINQRIAALMVSSAPMAAASSAIIQFSRPEPAPAQDNRVPLPTAVYVRDCAVKSDECIKVILIGDASRFRAAQAWQDRLSYAPYVSSIGMDFFINRSCTAPNAKYFVWDLAGRDGYRNCSSREATDVHIILYFGSDAADFERKLHWARIESIKPESRFALRQVDQYEIGLAPFNPEMPQPGMVNVLGYRELMLEFLDKKIEPLLSREVASVQQVHRP
ncbi:MAG: hypothetical protein ACHQAX_06490 [Gammaproteobacteria bacterium]